MMSANDLSFENISKCKVNEDFQFVPNISSVQGGGLQFWVNALQSGKDVHCNLTNENGLLKITLVDPVESNDVATNSSDKKKNISGQNVITYVAGQNSLEELSFFHNEEGSVIAHLNQSTGTRDVENDDKPNQKNVENHIEQESDCLPDDDKQKQPEIDVQALENKIATRSSNIRMLGISTTEEDSDRELNVTNNEGDAESKHTIIVTVTSEDSEKSDENQSPADPEIFPCTRTEWYNKPAGLDSDGPVDSFSGINTTVLAADLRQFLKHHSIPLVNFSKTYLGRSQGTLSDLLNHPKPWRSLNTRGRSIYFKMTEFLSSENLPCVVEKLKEGVEGGRRGPCPDALPSELMKMLAAHEMPSRDYIKSVAVKHQLNPTYLTTYCESQLRQYPDSVDVIVEFEDESSDIDEGESRASKRKRSDVGSAAKSSFLPRSNEKQICPVFGCGLILGARLTLKNHVLTHAAHRPYACSKCDKTFGTLSNLHKHEKRHRIRKNPSKRAERVAYLRSRTDSTLSSEAAQPVTEEEISEASDDPAAKETSITSKSPTSESTCTCEVCSLPFRTMELLRNHVTECHASTVMHDGELHYSCHLCKKLFKTAKSLCTHQRSHSGDLPFECPFCKKRFITNFNCQRHVRTHSGSKPYKCPQCPARFTESKSVTAHLRTHTGEKPFKCDLCGKCFTQRGSLQSHMLLHADLRPFLCATCGKAFRQKANLRAHEERHSEARPYVCKVCNLSYPTKGDLHRHSFKHSNERRFVCNKCSINYTRLCYLTDHVKKAHHLSPFTCEQCNIDMPSKAALLTHRVHGCKGHVDGENAPKEMVEVDSIQSSPTFASIAQPVLSTTPASNHDKDGIVVPILPTTVIPDPTFVTSDRDKSFPLSTGADAPVAIVTDQGFVLAASAAAEVEATVTEESNGVANGSSFGLPVAPGKVLACSSMQDGNDPNLHSVIVSSEDYDQLEEGASYVILSVADSFS